MNFMTQAAEAVTIIGGLFAVISLVYVGLEFRRNRQIAEGQFLLEVTKMFADHKNIHVNLRPGGDWSRAGRNPASAEEWASVDAYLGLMERCEYLMEKKCLKPEDFVKLFGYRVNNVLQQAAIVQKIEAEREYWSDFIKLTKRLRRMGFLDVELPKS